MPRGVGAALLAVRRALFTVIPIREYPGDRRSGRDDRLGRVACRRAGPRPGAAPNAADLADGAYDIAAQASAAWEAAVCWDDEHARESLAQVRAV